MYLARKGEGKSRDWAMGEGKNFSISKVQTCDNVDCREKERDVSL